MFNFPYQKDPESGEARMRNAIHIYAKAAAELLEARVMTLDEVMAICNRNRMVWIECDASKTQKWGQNRGVSYSHENEAVQWARFVTVGSDGFLFRRVSDYGKTWRCWTAEPTEMQRKGVAWDEC